ncbi:MAG: CDP-glycerol glycerophosphotransferase family protein [Ignavibacteria bacterium]|nr:CDP-glycerol glycerophosphotransferase family protein [Ignavibacteria bacterium]
MGSKTDTEKSSGKGYIRIKSGMLIDKFRKKKTVILDIEELSFIPYILPIYESLIKKTNSISYYISTHYPGASELNVFGIPESKQFIVSMSKDLHETDLFLSPHIYGKGNKNSIRIHINHNQPVKYQSYMKRDFINFDVHFLTSPLHRKQTENTIKDYSLEEIDIKLFNIGYSKSDDLLCGKYSREKVLSDLGLDIQKKTILYAPSWDKGLSLRSFGESVIEEMLKNESINIIVKLHPISYSSEDGPNYKFYTGGINWKERLEKYNSYKNFRHVSEGKSDPLLAASDVMVTDLSSVALEFIMLDKPVIYINCPEFFEKTLKETYTGFGNTSEEFVKNDPKANAGRHTGIVVEEMSQLTEAVQRALNDPKEFSQKRKELAEMLTYNKGRAADAASDKILELLNLK